MYTTEPFQIEGNNIILGIFGSSTFVNAKKGEGRDIRSKAIERMVQVLRSINPRLVYITPSIGVSLHLTTVLDYLRIPFIIVSPSKGHFNRFAKEHKVLLSRAIGDCQTVIVVNDIKANLLNLLDLEKQAEDFILERSDLILSIYGSVKTENEKKRHSKLNEIEKDVIFLNYSI